MTEAITSDLYVLYRETGSGLTVYKSDFVDGKYRRITNTTLEHKAIRYDLYTAAKRAVESGPWMIKKVYTI
jgi:hypothetical protein